MKDPRRSRRYRTQRAAYIARHRPGAPCCLCGQGVDTRLGGNHPAGPTVEHGIPVRTILRTARTWAEAIDLACDERAWGLAHRRCQDQQGASVTNGRDVEPPPSRSWW